MPVWVDDVVLVARLLRMHPVSLGIDFGTSNTVIAVVDAASAAHILNVHSGGLAGRTLPSILCFKPDERRPQERPLSFAGASAIDEYVRRAGPARLVQSMKSFLGSRSFVDTRVFSHTYTLEQLVGELLAHLYEATHRSWRVLIQHYAKRTLRRMRSLGYS